MTPLYRQAVEQRKRANENRQAYHRLRDALEEIEHLWRQTWEAAQQEAREDPQPGDLWHEMLSFWCYVVARDPDRVTLLMASAPCSFPEDGRREEMTVAEFGTQTLMLDSRGNDVNGW